MNRCVIVDRFKDLRTGSVKPILMSPFSSYFPLQGTTRPRGAEQDENEGVLIIRPARQYQQGVAWWTSGASAGRGATARTELRKQPPPRSQPSAKRTETGPWHE